MSTDYSFHEGPVALLRFADGGPPIPATVSGSFQVKHQSAHGGGRLPKRLTCQAVIVTGTCWISPAWAALLRTMLRRRRRWERRVILAALMLQRWRHVVASN